MRVAVQLRSGSGTGADGGTTAPRWRRSVYLDETTRSVRLAFPAFTPIGHTATLTAGQIGSLLFVVDTVNTALGTSGQFWLDDIAFTAPANGTRANTRAPSARGAQVRTDSSR
jgi:hypothetical protein